MQNFGAKKSLGQNFLKSKEALRALVASAETKPEDVVLEVGPGKGILTEALLEKGARVVAVEKDDRMVSYLKDKFSKEIEKGKLTLIHKDILEFGPSSSSLTAHSYKLVANIPYYITGIFLRKFLSGNIQPSKMVLMLQKEVAKRIVAQDKKESILSISVKAYGTPKYVMTVHKKYFSPSPKVDSAILLIDNISKNFFTDFTEDEFFELVKKGFSQKRKMLAHNLEIPQEKKESFFSSLNINPKTRAEDITLGEWKKLLSHLKH